jgi:acetyl-CoA C-acetyltransferase
MFLDGLEDAYEAGRAMGTFAQDTADAYQLTREAQDGYAIESLRRAQGHRRWRLRGTKSSRDCRQPQAGDVVVDTDEQPGKAMPDKIPTLKPAFAKDGTITAATSQFDLGRRRRAGADAC